MDLQRKEKFLQLWKKYFGGTELPIVFYYGENDGSAIEVSKTKGHRCLIGDLAKVRKGESLCFNTESIGCFGGKRYLGFSTYISENFNYFLSCGIPGELAGERYIRTPELVQKLMENMPVLKKQGQKILFKRWDKLCELDNPEVVIFFATPDVLSGLFTLANFDQSEPNSTFSPFGAGCATIVLYPYLEIGKERPRAVIGMFDASARPYVQANILTFALPFSKFQAMIDYMEESFLITPSWDKIKNRIAKTV
ncbi:MAG: DUF169 domain-containing protein [Lentimicrobiaceae bacterium]|nr:DUF169 domain-containing protein [Lentimicrobiaceae bacterium]